MKEWKSLGFHEALLGWSYCGETPDLNQDVKCGSVEVVTLENQKTIRFKSCTEGRLAT